ncbi:hypothetical protein [Microbacterium sp. NPDC055455]
MPAGQHAPAPDIAALAALTAFAVVAVFAPIAPVAPVAPIAPIAPRLAASDHCRQRRGQMRSAI